MDILKILNRKEYYCMDKKEYDALISIRMERAREQIG